MDVTSDEFQKIRSELTEAFDGLRDGRLTVSVAHELNKAAGKKLDSLRAKIKALKAGSTN